MANPVRVRPASSVPWGTAYTVVGGGTVANSTDDDPANDNTYINNEEGDWARAFITLADTGTVTGHGGAGAIPSRAVCKVRAGNLGGGWRHGCPITVAGVGNLSGMNGSTNVTWLGFTEILLGQGPMTTWPDETVDVFLLYNSGGAGESAISEIYVDLYYVALPVVTVQIPAEATEYTDRDTVSVSWTNVLDSEGGSQYAYQVKIFDDGTGSTGYNAGGFNADTAVGHDTSGIITNETTNSWQSTLSLPNDTYRAYVRTAQLVNGSLHWSAWDHNTFTVNVGSPAVPTITVADDAANGRISVAVASGGAGTATTDQIQVVVSYDDWATWRLLRTADGDGLIDDYSATPDVYDYEAPNGTAAKYSVRAQHDFVSGFKSYSSWSAVVSDTWTSTDYWLKHPYDPTFNIAVQISSPATGGRSTQARIGIHQPLGSSEAIAITDKPLAETGVMKLRCDTDSDRDDLDDLLAEGVPLLLQTRELDFEPDKWISPGNHTRSRVVDKAFVAETWEEIEWTEVARPEGNLS